MALKNSLVLFTIFATLISFQSCLHFETAFPEISILLPVDLDYLSSTSLIYTSSLPGQVYTHPVSDTATASVWFDFALSTSAGVEFYTDFFLGGENGLSSIEFHPNYPSVPKFYAYHTSTPSRIQVTSWTVSAGKVDYSSGEVLLDFARVPLQNEVRVGGDLQFDSTGNLYISVGDTTNTTAAQDPQNFLGKVLRITPSARGSGYSIPASNPYVHQSSCGQSEIFSIGFRNPRKMLFPTLNAKLIVGEVGEINNEIMQVQVGDNCGWDLIDGCNPTGSQLPRGNYKYPAYYYSESVLNAITLGPYFPRTREKSELTTLQNTILYADLYSGQLFAIRYQDMDKTCANNNAEFVAQAPSAVSAILLVDDTVYVASPFSAFYGAPCFARLVTDD